MNNNYLNYNKMRKFLFMCLIAFGLMFTSCTTTKNYMSTKTYVNKVSLLKDYYNENGFYLNGTASNTNNTLMYSGTWLLNEYSSVPIFYNDFLIKDTYKFKNENGDYVNFTLGYKIDKFEIFGKGGESQKNEYEIIYSEVCDCETNDYKLYENLCKNKNLIDFYNVDKADKIKIVDGGATLGACVFGILGSVFTLYILSSRH